MLILHLSWGDKMPIGACRPMVPINNIGPFFCLFPVKYKPDYVQYFAGEFHVVSVF